MIYPIINSKSSIINRKGLRSTPVENVRQIHSFMQNKPNVKYAQINLNSYMTSKYEKLDTWLFRKTKPIQTQLPKGQKLMQSLYLQRIMKKYADWGYEKTNPIQTQSKPILKRQTGQTPEPLIRLLWSYNISGPF